MTMPDSLQLERAVEIVPAEPPSPELRVCAGLTVGWADGGLAPRGVVADLPSRRSSSHGTVGAREAEVRALTVLGGDLAYLGRAEEGLAHLRHALRLAEEIGDRWGLDRAYVNLTDALTMLGRPGESARLGQAGLEVLRRYGIESAVLAANTIEALLAIGEWAEADRLSTAALRVHHGQFPLHAPHAPRRPRTRAWRVRGRAGTPRGRAPHAARGPRPRNLRCHLAELALWEHRWMDADQAVRDAWPWRARAGPPAPRLVLRQGSAGTGGAGRVSPAPAATPTPSRPGSNVRTNSSPSLATPPRRQRR